jgi:drug/metabolite transporter (DMT)-like permease
MFGDTLPLWVIFALAAVVGKTAFYGYQKVLLGTYSSLVLGYIASVSGAIVCVPLAAYHISQNGFSLSLAEVGILLAIGVVEFIAFAIYLRAVELTDLSIASPLKRTKPVVVAVLEPVVFGIAFVPVVGFAAVSAALGGYIVLMNGRKLLTPLRRLNTPGPRLAFVAAFLYGLLSLGSRYGTTTTSPYVFGAFVFVIMSIGYTGLLSSRGELPSPQNHLKGAFVIVGILGVSRSLLVWMAYSLASASLVVAVTQLTVLTDVIVGGALLKEDGLLTRVIGAGLILAGVYLVLVVV